MDDSHQESAVGKIVRDVVLGVLGGIVIEATIQRFNLEWLFPFLPYIGLRSFHS